jgi:hypothetical protein
MVRGVVQKGFGIHTHNPFNFRCRLGWSSVVNNLYFVDHPEISISADVYVFGETLALRLRSLRSDFCDHMVVQFFLSLRG